MLRKPLVVGVLALWSMQINAETTPLPSDALPQEQSDSLTNGGDRPEGEDGPTTDSLPPSAEPALKGMIVDRTVTMMGKAFFSKFSQLRLDSIILSNTSLVVHERPSARWGSIVWVAEGNSILFQATLPPRLSEVDQYAEAAVGQVEQLVLQRKVTQALQQSPDLADDEF